MGRHSLVRVLTERHCWQLHLAGSYHDEQPTSGVADKLVRIIRFPDELPEREFHFIMMAIWDAVDAVHDWALRVVDVISTNGSVALVHDHTAGNLLELVRRGARDAGRSFPVDIALRVALDVADGIEHWRELREAGGIPWRSGGVATDSLYLCASGHTRALDTSILAEILRSPCLRALATDSSPIAPEILDASWEPDERADVFAIAAVLLELMAPGDAFARGGAALGDASPTEVDPQRIPEGLSHVLSQALARDPAQRHATLQEFVVALATSAQNVATHAQVAAFAATILSSEPSQDGDWEVLPADVLCESTEFRQRESGEARSAKATRIAPTIDSEMSPQSALG